jgi:hypothetical protein
MNIIFAYTSFAFVAREKNVTRRDWDEEYAERFYAGTRGIAVNKQLRFGGEKIGTFRLTAKPSYESEAQMPDRDYAGEGFEFLDQYPYLKPKMWANTNLKLKFDEDRRAAEWLWVVRYEILTVERAWEIKLVEKMRSFSPQDADEMARKLGLVMEAAK